MMINKHVGQIKPHTCEKILNFNGFYPHVQKHSQIAFIDDLGRVITIPRGSIPLVVFRKIVKRFNLVLPEKCY